MGHHRAAATQAPRASGSSALPRQHRVAFTLNPTSAELGNAVDRRGLSCYAAVYAVYNIAYSVGMMATNTLASAAVGSIGFLDTLICASVALLACVPFLLQKDTSMPTAAPRTVSSNREGERYA